MSSIWFWGVLITFELLLIGVVGYGLTSYQAFNTIASQLQLDSTKLRRGQPKISSQYLIINQAGKIKQGSQVLTTPVPTSLSNPSSLPNNSVIYDDLYAYHLRNLGQSNDYLVTYLPYKKNNPWPERAIFSTITLIVGAITAVGLFQILNKSREGSFAIS